MASMPFQQTFLLEKINSLLFSILVVLKISAILSQIIQVLKFANQFSRHGKSVQIKANSPMTVLYCGNCKFAVY